MKALVYALAGCLLILAAPLVSANDDCIQDICPPPINGTGGGECAVFTYWINPEPGYRLDLDCL